MGVDVSQHQAHVPGQWFSSRCVVAIEATAGNHVLELQVHIVHGPALGLVVHAPDTRLFFIAQSVGVLHARQLLGLSLLGRLVLGNLLLQGHHGVLVATQAFQRVPSKGCGLIAVLLELIGSHTHPSPTPRVEAGHEVLSKLVQHVLLSICLGGGLEWLVELLERLMRT